MYLCELSGSKFHSVTSSNVILYMYNDVKNSTFHKKFMWFWNILIIEILVMIAKSSLSSIMRFNCEFLLFIIIIYKFIYT